MNNFAKLFVGFSFKHVFNAATTQGPWKQAPATTVTTTKLAGNYGQEQQLLPAIPVNGGRQKSTVR